MLTRKIMDLLRQHDAHHVRNFNSSYIVPLILYILSRRAWKMVSSYANFTHSIDPKYFFFSSKVHQKFSYNEMNLVKCNEFLTS